MKTSIKELKIKFQYLLGDTSLNITDEFVINAVNWAFNDLPLVPKLGRLFSKHYQSNLDAKGHYRWKLNRDFRRLIDLPMLNFYTSTGGEPCKLNVCHRDVEEFYSINGLPYLRTPGKPCQYTIEQEDDDIYLVFDRPLNVPIILDYIAYGFPKPVKDIDEVRDISSIAEQLIISVMQTVWYREADDFNFAGHIYDYLDNKKIPEAIQALNKAYGSDRPLILGEL